MINYHSNSQFKTPAYPQGSPQSPYMGQNHQDVFQGLQQAKAVDLSRYAQQQQDAYETAAERTQRELALAGLTQMGQTQNNAQNLQTGRMQMLLAGLL